MERTLDPGMQKVIDNHIKELGGEETINSIKIMKEILNKSFGEENNQIIQPSLESFEEQFKIFGYYDGYICCHTSTQVREYLRNYKIGYQIIIYFPEVTITNSIKNSHVIKDLYVKFIFGEDARMYPAMWGVRTTLSTDECLAQYMHSHLPSYNPSVINFNHFCTGEGEINQVIALLSTKFDEVNFTLLCLHLKVYVGWESIEGTPYRHISNIGIAGTGNLRRNEIASIYVDKVVGILKSAMFHGGDSKKIRDSLSYRITQASVLVEATEDFEKWAADYIMKVDKNEIEKYKNDNLWLLCVKDEAGNYFQPDLQRNNRRIIAQTTPILKFKGQDKFLTITKQTNEIKSEKYLNPIITQKFCWSLTRDFTKIALNSKGIEEQEDTTISIPEVAEPDLFPL